MKSLLISITLLIISILNFSCSKVDMYSCDPTINKRVSRSLDKIQTMNRSEWLKLDDISYQKGIYVAFSKEQKVNLWISKFNDLLNLNWNKSEYEHIVNLKTVVQNNTIWFQQNCPEADFDNKDLFMYEWIDYATNQLNWTKELIYAIAFTAESLSQDKTLIRSKIIKHSVTATRSEPGGGGTIVCDCSNPESAHYISCSISDHDCISGGCKTTTRNCGWLWGYPCNGLCYTK